MTFEINAHKGEFKKGITKDNRVVYICNFLTDEDDTITLYLTEEQVKPYINLKKYDNCKVPVRLYKSEKGKYGLTGDFSIWF